MSRKLGIDYGLARTGLAITDELGITAQGLETVTSNGNDKIILKRIDEIMQQYEIWMEPKAKDVKKQKNLYIN